MSLDVHLWAPGFVGFGGGIGAFSGELALALHRGGHRVVLWGKQDREGQWQGMSLGGCGAMPAPFRTAMFALGGIWRALRHKPALVICTHLNFGPAAMLLSRLTGVPYVLIAHGIDVHPGLSTMRRRALAGARAVWPVSRWTRERLMGLGISEAAIRVLANTVDDSRFTIGEPRETTRQRIRMSPSEKVILTVARLDAGEGYKGYDAIVRALPAIRSAVGPVRYVIAGQGDDAPRIRRMAEDLGVADLVTLCGFVPDDELPDYYRLADVFAMPSRGEGFGIVFLEAMASGLPVLGGCEDGAVDALDDGQLGVLVNPLDDAAVAEGLEQLLLREGPPMWFEPMQLREECLARFGRAAFGARVAAAIAALDLGVPA